MKTILSTAFSVCICILLLAGPTRAQGVQGMSGESLKERIELLEKTDLKSKSPTVQLIYKRSLLRLYGDYASALEQEIADLKNIQSAVGGSDPTARSEATAQALKLTGELNVTMEKIRTLTGDLQAAVSSSSGTPSREASAVGAPVSAGPARYEQVSYPQAEAPKAAAYTGSLALPSPALTRGDNQSPPLLTGVLRAGADTALAATTPAAGTPPAAENVVGVDWQTRTAGCPPKVTQSSTRATVRVTNINDILVDFNTGAKAEYQLRAKGTPVSAVAPGAGIFTGQSGALDSNCPIQNLQALLNHIRQQVNANPFISPPQPGGRSIPLSTTLGAALNIEGVSQILNAISQGTCTNLFAGFTNDPVFSWVSQLRGSHSYDFSVVLEPNQNYEFTLKELWKGAETSGGEIRWNCGEKDIFTLSVGPLVSTLPSRTYNHQKAPVPPGSTTTQDILTVGNKSNLNVLGAALINYHFPQPRFLPNRAGLALSVGPVYTLGSTPNVSALGLFVGTSFNLSRSVFLTPGVHIGQFADFPEGFGPGSVIPNQFGDLNPVKRMTAKFAIGITFKTNSFKKSSESGGTASNTASAGGSGATQPAGGSQSTSGSQGTGSGTPGGTPQPKP
jgi:hypothetical protein